MSSLYEELKNNNSENFKVDHDYSLNFPYSCKECIIKDYRSPEHCDPCPANPDRERLIRSRLLNKNNK